MELFLAFGLIHVLGGFVWAATLIVTAFILLSASRDDAMVPRALPEVERITRRVLRPAILATTLTGVVLALAGGLAFEAWAILSTALAVASLIAGARVVAPACKRALGMPGGAALVQGRRALGLAGVDLGAQSAAIALMVLTPGWSGAAILAGLTACIVLAVALLRETGGDARAA